MVFVKCNSGPVLDNDTHFFFFFAPHQCPLELSKVVWDQHSSCSCSTVCSLQDFYQSCPLNVSPISHDCNDRKAPHFQCSCKWVGCHLSGTLSGHDEGMGPTKYALLCVSIWKRDCKEWGLRDNKNKYKEKKIQLKKYNLETGSER